MDRLQFLFLAFAGCLAACSGSNASPGSAAAAPGTVNVVIDTASPGDGVVQFHVAAARLERVDGLLTGQLLRESTIVTFTDPSGEVASLRLHGVPGGEYRALRLGLVPGSGIVTQPGGQLRSLGADLEVSIPIPEPLLHPEGGVSWLVVGHNSGPTVAEQSDGSLRWTPTLAGRAEDSVLPLTGLDFALRQGDVVTTTLAAFGDAAMQVEFAASCSFGDDDGSAYSSSDDFLSRLQSGDELRVHGALGRRGRLLAFDARRGRGNDNPRLLGRILELEPVTTSFRMRVQAEVRRGNRAILDPPVEVVIRAGSARIQRPNNQPMSYAQLAVGNLVKVKWSSRGVENGVPVFVAVEIEVPPGNGVPMRLEWQGRVQSVDLVSRTIVVVPRNNDPIVIQGTPVPQVDVLVGPTTQLQRRERHGGARYPIQLEAVVPGSDRIWWGGSVTGPTTIEASWIRVRED
jgi:hypothetical protein